MILILMVQYKHLHVIIQIVLLNIGCTRIYLMLNDLILIQNYHHTLNLAMIARPIQQYDD